VERDMVGSASLLLRRGKSTGTKGKWCDWWDSRDAPGAAPP
jgi:hypothetical protein